MASALSVIDAVDRHGNETQMFCLKALDNDQSPSIVIDDSLYLCLAKEAIAERLKNIVFFLKLRNDLYFETFLEPRLPMENVRNEISTMSSLSFAASNETRLLYGDIEQYIPGAKLVNASIVINNKKHGR